MDTSIDFVQIGLPTTLADCESPTGGAGFGSPDAIFMIQGRFGFSSVNTISVTPSSPLFGPPGYEINLLYIAGLVALAFSGPTALSVDRVIAREKVVDC